MNQTTNYSLPQWEASDRVTRGDMNDAMSAIDTALAVKCEVVFGSYSGNAEFPRTIELGFRPRAVLIMTERGITYSSSTYGGLFGTDKALVQNGVPYAQVSATGFKLFSGTGNCTNMSGIAYHYIAFK